MFQPTKEWALASSQPKTAMQLLLKLSITLITPKMIKSRKRANLVDTRINKIKTCLFLTGPLPNQMLLVK